jgi:hypothetical protein
LKVKGSREDRYSILDAGYSIKIGKHPETSIEHPVSSIESKRRG